MPLPTPPPSEQVILAGAIILALTAVLLAALCPGFSFDNTLVYQGF